MELQNFVQVRVQVQSHERYENRERNIDMGRWFHQTLHFWHCKLVKKDACSGSLYEKNCNPRRDTWMIEKLAYVCCKAEDMESKRSQTPSENYNQVVVHEATQTEIDDLELQWGDNLLKKCLRKMPSTRILSPRRLEQEE